MRFTCRSLMMMMTTLMMLLLLLAGNVVAYNDEQLQATFRTKSSGSFGRVESSKDGNVSHVIDALLRNYDKRLRPNYKGDPVVVGVTMFVTRISSISEINMDFTLDFSLKQCWKDTRLVHDESGEEELILSSEILDQIWRPDTFFVNAKSATLHTATAKNAFVRIKNVGFVTQSLRLTVTAMCSMDLRLFPMDIQICSLEIESYAYPMEHILYSWNDGPNKSVTFHEDLYLPHFKLKEFRISEKLDVISTGNYSRLVLQLKLIRRLGYYIIQIYVPSSFLVVLSWVSFWLDRNCAPVRLALSVTIILTLTTFTSSTNVVLPKLDYLKSIDVYLAMCFIMVFAVLLEFAMVSFIENKPWIPVNQLEVLSQLNTVEGKRLAHSGGLKTVKKISLPGPIAPNRESKSVMNQNTPAIPLTEPVWRSFEATSKLEDVAEVRKINWNAPQHGNSVIQKSTASIQHQTLSLTNPRVTPSPIEKPTTSTFSSDHLSLNEFVFNSSDQLKNSKDFPLFRLKIGGGNEIFHKKRRLNWKGFLFSGPKSHDRERRNISLAKSTNQNHEIAKSIDGYSKILFPSVFVAFVVLYWITYATIISWESTVGFLSC
uniref:Gamma-aminobutyric acid receptor subunit beta n=1 Tax=Hirudo verbana TaxID=311461 RepID=A0A2S1WLZ6_9ANNE|nr:putative GABA receptor 1 [Hirudo verbana]